MSKNSSARTLTAPASQAWGARNLAYCALLAALSIVFARLIIPMPNETTRFSIEAVPIFLAGLFFGPVAGGLVGFSADLIGCLFSGYGYNPIFCVPPILYGVTAGLFQGYLVKKRTQCCLGGICEWVVCPGARNMALLQVLAAAEDLVQWTHFDERSAAFFACLLYTSRCV